MKTPPESAVDIWCYHGQMVGPSIYVLVVLHRLELGPHTDPVKKGTAC
jgi:hypothetical protein